MHLSPIPPPISRWCGLTRLMLAVQLQRVLASQGSQSQTQHSLCATMDQSKSKINIACVQNVPRIMSLSGARYSYNEFSPQYTSYNLNTLTHLTMSGRVKYVFGDVGVYPKLEEAQGQWSL